jgi:16S rRNA (cytidine1402-2'-O)-methyltransferase
MPGTLYVVATPIGNLEDITARARLVLGEVALVLAEDTRRVGKLLGALGLSTPVESYHGDTAADKRARLVRKLASGTEMALASDAGTPVVADPGATLVADAAQAGVRVVPVPGPSAVTAALSVSGMRGDRFEFAGYAPRRESERRELLSELTTSPVTSVFYETPHRLQDCLADLAQVAGADQPVVICRELTKLHEEILRTTAAEAAEHFAQFEPLGELVLLLPPGEAADRPEGPSDEQVRAAAEKLAEIGASTRDAADLLSELTGRARNDMYDLMLEIRDS